MEKFTETPIQEPKEKFLQLLGDRKKLWQEIVQGSNLPPEEQAKYLAVLDDVTSPEGLARYDDLSEWSIGSWAYTLKGRLVDIHLFRLGRDITDPELVKEYQAVYQNLRDDIDAFVTEVGA